MPHTGAALHSQPRKDEAPAWVTVNYKRIGTPLVYWLLVGPRSGQRPEVAAFCNWLHTQAERTRMDIGDGPDNDTLASPY